MSAENVTDTFTVAPGSLTPEQEDFLQKKAFEQGSKVAQIFSGVFFSGLAGWLTISNGTKLAFVQRAALEKRLTVCCFLNTYVGFFSAFFNFFQLTDVDNLILPERQGSAGFVVDFARPIEWLCTCPLMQLSLVLMGGAKIPEYRRYLMPFFSASILILGTASTFIPSLPGRIVCYVVAVGFFSGMVWFNRQQILEYSQGEEGLLMGDSEFRKATLLLVATWMPFPTWYLLSPECLGVIDNVLLIQVGWAFLNIVAKFVFIFYIQRIKDLYCNRLKTKRELNGSRWHGIFGGNRHNHGAVSPRVDGLGPENDEVAYENAVAYEQAEVERKKSQLSAVVVETMSFLGMAQHTDRFLRLLERANMRTISEVEVLTKEQCEELQLPFDLVTALQRRLRVWKLEMVDDAEMGLDRGEEHYIKKGMLGKEMEMPHAVFEGMGVDGAVLEGMLRNTESHILQGQNFQLWESALKAVCEKLDHHMTSMEQRLNEHIETTVKTSEQRGEARAFETRLNSRLDDLAKATDTKADLVAAEKRLGQAFEQHLALMATKVDLCCQKVEAMNQKVDVCSQKIDTCHASDVSLQAENLDKVKMEIGRALEEVSQGFRSVLKTSEASQNALLQKSSELQTSQTRLAEEGKQAWRSRLEDLESWLTNRRDEQKAEDKHRFDELVTNFAKTAKSLEDLSTQVQKTSERSEAAVQLAASNMNSEAQSSAAKILSKMESVHASSSRGQHEFESAVQNRLEELVSGQASIHSSQKTTLETAFRMEKAVEALDNGLYQQVQRVVDQAGNNCASRAERAMESAEKNLVAAFEKGSQRTERAVEALDHGIQKRFEYTITQTMTECAEKGAQQAAARAQKAVELIDDCLQKRLDDAVSRAGDAAAYAGAAHANRSAEKAIEALEGAQRNELHSAITNLLERIDDINSVQARKATERDDRTGRRIEELVELASNRTSQKVEDVGLDLKRELHGFAKRLNSKIPFM